MCAPAQRTAWKLEHVISPATSTPPILNATTTTSPTPCYVTHLDRPPVRSTLSSAYGAFVTFHDYSAVPPTCRPPWPVLPCVATTSACILTREASNSQRRGPPAGDISQRMVTIALVLLQHLDQSNGGAPPRLPHSSTSPLFLGHLRCHSRPTTMHLHSVPLGQTRLLHLST